MIDNAIKNPEEAKKAAPIIIDGLFDSHHMDIHTLFHSVVLVDDTSNGLGVHSIDAYYEIQESKEKTKIGNQFQYNQYIRDFFEDNKDKKLEDAIICCPKLTIFASKYVIYETSQVITTRSIGGR